MQVFSTFCSETAVSDDSITLTFCSETAVSDDSITLDYWRRFQFNSISHCSVTK
jgi:hypothetical protein